MIYQVINIPSTRNIRFKTPMLRSYLCDYSDNQRNKSTSFTNNAPFRSCISKINNTLLDNAEDPDIAMPVFNLLEYCGNYFMTSGSLLNCYRDEVNGAANESVHDHRVINKVKTGESLKYNTKIIGRASANDNALITNTVVHLKYLSNFKRSIDLTLINCETDLDLTWPGGCIISRISEGAAVPVKTPNPARKETEKTSATLQINKAKPFLPVVTLSINDNINFLENRKQRFRTTASWNKYRSEVTTQPKDNNLDYMIDPTFINRLFVLSFWNGDDDCPRDSFDKFYLKLVETKDFNALIYNKPFFDQPAKNKQAAHGNRVEISRNDDYTTEILLIIKNIINSLAWIYQDKQIQALFLCSYIYTCTLWTIT